MRTSSAFSLVEVTISIGIVAFALMAILGLISVSMMSSERASEDTALALATKKICADLSEQGFQTDVINANYSYTYTYYFDKDGRDITNDATGQKLYRCVVTSMVPPASIYTPQATGGGYLQYFQLAFAWPLTASAANQRTRTLITSLANYD